ncbi:MAG: family 1 glycosylhydrolase [Clostridia bacterium]|nr:family 1 glycosylhydrolase [Clostridia bacterium]
MDKFLFGVATSATQIEGAYNKGGKGLSIWDEFSRKGLIQNGMTCFKACDSYNKVQEDLDLLKELGVNSYRFSISWPRIQPDGFGSVNKEGIDYYNKLIDGLIERNIKPMVTLFHWDMPVKLFEDGGFSNREIVERFEEYGKIVAENFGDRVELFSVMNEAEAVIDFMCLRPVGNGYAAMSKQQAFECLHNLLLCNAAATYSLRKYSKCKVKVGMVNTTRTLIPNEAKAEAAAYKAMFTCGDELFGNTTFWDPVFFGKYDERLVEKQNIDLSFVKDGDMEYIKCIPDFLGLNIYIGTNVELNALGEIVFSKPSPNATFGDMSGDYMNTAKAMYYGPKFMQKRYGKPVYVTENGCSLSECLIDGKVEDQIRTEYIRRYLAELIKAKCDGVDVRGYYVWTLMDNFEWSSGFTRRFGLVYVDFETCKRYPKNSFYQYKNLIGEYQNWI